MKQSIYSIISKLILAGFLLAACSSEAAHEKVQPSSLEPIEGTDFSRVILTQRAADRVGIEVSQVQEEVIQRTHSFGSEVVSFSESGGTNQDTLWLRVSLNESMQQMVDRSAPVRIRDIDDKEDDDANEILGEPDDDREDEDADENYTTLYYKVNDAKHRYSEGQRLLVEIPLVGNGEIHKKVPYSAVIYGVHGETWVYTNPEPLVFVREPIVIDYIHEDWAILSEGPAAGTDIVIVGGTELFGTETGVSK